MVTINWMPQAMPSRQKLQKRLGETLAALHEPGVIIDHDERQRHEARAGRAKDLRIGGRSVGQRASARLQQLCKLRKQTADLFFLLRINDRAAVRRARSASSR